MPMTPFPRVHGVRGGMPYTHPTPGYSASSRRSQHELRKCDSSQSSPCIESKGIRPYWTSEKSHTFRACANPTGRYRWNRELGKYKGSFTPAF